LILANVRSPTINKPTPKSVNASVLNASAMTVLRVALFSSKEGRKTDAELLQNATSDNNDRCNLLSKESRPDVQVAQHREVMIENKVAKRGATAREHCGRPACLLVCAGSLLRSYRRNVCSCRD